MFEDLELRLFAAEILRCTRPFYTRCSRQSFVGCTKSVHNLLNVKSMLGRPRSPSIRVRPTFRASNSVGLPGTSDSSARLRPSLSHSHRADHANPHAHPQILNSLCGFSVLLHLIRRPTLLRSRRSIADRTCAMKSWEVARHRQLWICAMRLAPLHARRQAHDSALRV